MLDLYEAGDESMKPSLQTYLVLFKACGNVNGSTHTKAEALSIALNAFQKLDESEYLRPNHFIYSVLIELCGKLIPNTGERGPHIEKNFRRCCVIRICW